MDELYEDALLVEVYDAVNASRSDFTFYRQRLPSPPARILDIGCGTGTFAIELAGAGYSTTAVDPACAMIDAARKKPGSDGVEWVVGSLSDLSGNTCFDVVVMTGHAFQCLLTDEQVLGLLEGVASRLSPEGSFWFETRNPLQKAWTRWTPEHAGPPISLGEGRSVQVTHDVHAMEGEIVTFSEFYSFDGGKRVLKSQSRLRFLSYEAVERLTARAGLSVSSVKGDWNGGAFLAESPEIIFELKKSS